MSTEDTHDFLSQKLNEIIELYPGLTVTCAIVKNESIPGVADPREKKVVFFFNLPIYTKIHTPQFKSIIDTIRKSLPDYAIGLTDLKTLGKYRSARKILDII